MRVLLTSMNADKHPLHRVDIPGLYRYYTRNLYRVLTIATHTETGERLVIYTTPEAKGVDDVDLLIVTHTERDENLILRKTETGISATPTWLSPNDVWVDHDEVWAVPIEIFCECLPDGQLRFEAV